MEKFSNFFSMLTNTGADLELDDIFIIIFVSLVILALLLGYLLGRKMTGKEKKKIKAAKKMAKQEKAEAKKQAKIEKPTDEEPDTQINQPLKKKDKKPKKEKKNKDKQTDWFDADDNDDVPSAMPIIPERKTTTFIETKKNEDIAPVEVEEIPEEKPLSKSEQKKKAKAEAYAKKLEAKEQAKAEKLSKKAAKKQPKDDAPETTIQVELTEDSEPITAEEMAKRLESIMGTTSEVVSLGVAEEEDIPAEKVGTIEATQIPGRHNDNWVLEETKRQNEEADKKEAERKEKEALPFAFGSDIEASADDVQLSYKARKKLREEEAKKAQEEEQKKERKHITSIFAKKQEEESVSEQEEEYFDENYMGEEIPDSLAGFGFSAAPKLNNDEEKSEE